MGQAEKTRVIITVIGQDKPGIIAGISGLLAAADCNILDISQTILQEMFTMIMIVDISAGSDSVQELRSKLQEKGKTLGVSVTVQHEDVFKFMHRV